MIFTTSVVCYDIFKLTCVAVDIIYEFTNVSHYSAVNKILHMCSSSHWPPNNQFNNKKKYRLQ